MEDYRTSVTIAIYIMQYVRATLRLAGNPEETIYRDTVLLYEIISYNVPQNGKFRCHDPVVAVYITPKCKTQLLERLELTALGKSLNVGP